MPSHLPLGRCVARIALVFFFSMFAHLFFFATILNLADLRQAVTDEFAGERTFSLTCTIVRAGCVVGTQGLRSTNYTLTDGSGSFRSVSTNGLPVLPPATRVFVSGHIGVERNGWPRPYITSLNVLGTGHLPEPVLITASQLNDERFDACLVRLRGIVCEIQPDEVDPKYAIIRFRSPEGSFLGVTSSGALLQMTDFRAGASVLITGIAHNRGQGGKRHFQNAMIDLAREDVRILKSAPQDPFATVPDIRNVSHMSTAAVANLNLRKTKGCVIAQLADAAVLLRTPEGRIVRVYFACSPMPDCGVTVEVVGFPETDLFSLILTGAVFRLLPPEGTADVLPCRVSASDLIFRDVNTVRFQPEHYGKLVCVSGTFERPPKSSSRMPTLTCGGETFNLDFTSCPSLIDRLQSGSFVDVTGICLFETELWTMRRLHPRIRGVTLVPRAVGDIRILKPAPWWTTRVLLCIIVSLVGIIFVILIWNRIMRMMMERRGRERVADRTRLAADLHDSIAQTMTGVGFQIDAAAKTLSNRDLSACADFLLVAKRTLLSCREEVRRCIWDLRTRALENPDLTSAIREIVHPIVGTATVAVRFHVPRAQISDATTHTLLCIIRELAANAVRHGQARHVRIAGEYKDGCVRFSVTDDGIGFVSNGCPGPAQGHFGLQGIRERLSKWNGSMVIKSVPNRGTRIVVEIRGQK